MSALRKPWASFDGPLLISVLAIIGMGLVNLYSATRVAPKGLFSTQLMFFGIGTVLFLLPVAIFTFLLRNHLLRGMSFGAIRK